MRRMTTSYGSTVYAFDDLKEVLDNCDGSRYQRGEDGRTGLPIPNWNTLLAAVDRPWQQGLEAVDKFVAELEQKELPDLQYIRRRINYSEDDGDEIDLDRMRSGQSYWRRSTRESVIGPTEVTIITDVSADKTVSPTDILWRGAAAVAMAKVLEDRGYSVELWVTRASCPYEGHSNDGTDSWDRAVIAVCLKRAGDRLDVSSLVNGVSAWFYRTALFTLTRTLAAREGKRLAAGLGTPERPYTQELDCFSSPVNRLYSMSSFTFGGALAATEWGLQKVKESQSPPVPVYDDDGDDNAQDGGSKAPPPPPKTPPKPPKKVRQQKVKEVKVPKRLTES